MYSLFYGIKGIETFGDGTLGDATFGDRKIEFCDFGDANLYRVSVGIKFQSFFKFNFYRYTILSPSEFAIHKGMPG
jgi:hypothetical protein